MIFGIDFGTTNTVVSHFRNGSVEYLTWDDESVLYPTEINGLKNIKRLIAENSNNLNREIFENVISFFQKIHAQIRAKYAAGEIIECVLTVPARFNDITRNAIKSAAIAANFHVLKLITEPVAASLRAIDEKKDGLYIVYDLGGGTFDVSLLNYSNNVFQVLAIDGLANFGGLDIDKIIAEHLNVSLDQAKQYKESGDFASNAKLADLISESLQKTYAVITNLLKEQNLAVENIHGLILVGGASQLPMIFQELSKNFKVHKMENPDYIVSAGASLQGAILAGRKEGEENFNGMLIDAIPFNFGVETMDDKVEVMIPKNSPLPYMHEEYFYPSSENVKINILQGVSDKASECIKLATFEFVRPKEKFSITFMVDFDGILSVRVGSEVFVVSENNMASSEVNPIVADLLQKVLTYSELNSDQTRFLNYLKQAQAMDLSNQAIDWLEEQYAGLFDGDVCA